MTVDALAEEFREKFPRNFAKRAETPIGTTAAPAGSKWTGGNPYSASPEQRNLTEIGKLYVADRALHDRWKAEAEGAAAPAPKPAADPLTGDLGRFFRPGKDFNLSTQGRIFREDRATYDRIKAAMAS